MNRIQKMNGVVIGVSFVAALTMTSVASAQEEMIRRRDDKLAESWVRDAGWVIDYDRARKKAAASGKVIFAYFTRSYSP